MPQPAPARFDGPARRAVVTSLLSATGPTLTMSVLVGGYALSTRACVPSMRWWVAGIIAAAFLGTLASTVFLIARSDDAEPRASQTLRPAAVGIQIFCMLVLIAFSVALATAVRCD
jgi:hypothetical protein